ncbi:MAG: hypothetical protein LR008_02625 [Candidatus Pacebacteria bacterium]|nr:hypothetical protein [Candidatus Paceibacterota bacterium]
MINKRTVIFLILFSIFGLAHYFAVLASLYWYYGWFDVAMHLWGGMLIGLSVHSLATFSRFNFKPTLSIILLVLVSITVTWEIFEWWADLYQSEAYLIDTIQDILLGFSGGLLTHFVLSKYTIET